MSRRAFSRRLVYPWDRCSTFGCGIRRLAASSTCLVIDTGRRTDITTEASRPTTLAVDPASRQVDRAVAAFLTQTMVAVLACRAVVAAEREAVALDRRRHLPEVVLQEPSHLPDQFAQDRQCLSCFLRAM